MFFFKASNTSLSSSYVNLLSTIIGSGILGFPYAFSKTGWILGFLLIAACGLFSLNGLILFSACASRFKRPIDFDKLSGQISPLFSIIVDVSICIKCFGVSTVYLIVVGDLMPSVALDWNFPAAFSRREVWVLFAFIMSAPLSLFHSLEHLKYTSLISLLFVIFVVIVVVLYSLGLSSFDPCPLEINCKGENNFMAESLSDVFKVISIFVFGFTCHQNLFAVYNELEGISPDQLSLLLTSAIFSGIFIYFITAFGGYITFGDKVASNLLKNYPNNSTSKLICLFVSLIEIFHFPLQVNPARRSLLSLCDKLFGNCSKSCVRPDRFLSIRYFFSSFLLLISSLLIALSIKDLGIMMEFIGATGSTLLTYILPATLFFHLFPSNKNICDCDSIEISQEIAPSYNSIFVHKGNLYRWRILAGIQLFVGSILFFMYVLFNYF